MKHCLDCGEQIEGRVDKKFCSEYCRSSYHYKINKEKEAGLFKTIDIQLKLNRRILKKYNKAGKSSVRRKILLEEGFNPKYFTHYWKNPQGKVYLFCYEYGFLAFTEHHKEKYLLVTWQNYMEKLS